ncbi:MAG: glycosyltransferase family 1 protein [Candidatus Magasanikbacteria bacterium]|nr:glycosyltransferase family 1 protein [Candidatus Magasanikbacteria bacterium]
MNIGIDIRTLMTAPRTGVGEYTFELLNAILTIDRTNQYFLFYNSSRDVSDNIPHWQYDNVKIIGSHTPNKFFNASLALFGRPRLDRLVDKKSIDYWFAPNLNFTALSAKTKYILTVHDLSFQFFPEFSTGKQYWWHKAVHPRKQCERANLIITPSENTKYDIMDYYHIAPEKIRVIYPGIKQGEGASITKEILQKYNLPEKFILFLGTIEPRKNITGLIDAFEKYSGDCTLVIAGASGWKNESIFIRMRTSKCRSRVKFIGFIAPEDKFALYSAAQIFVYPSLYEGFGFPVLEAMAAGTPVITSNRSSLPEIAGSAAYLVDPARPDQITSALNELFTKPALRDRYIQKGYEQSAKFSWEKAAREWLNCIPSI